jgi:hypothetical protein
LSFLFLHSNPVSNWYQSFGFSRVISNALISIVLVIMAVCGRRGQANLVAAPEAPPRGDPRDIEMEALGERYEASERGASHHGSDVEVSSNDGDEVNPFHHAHSHTSSDSTPPHPRNLRNHVFRRDCDVKVDIPEFEGRMQPDEFIDWLNTIERILLQRCSRSQESEACCHQATKICLYLVGTP